MADGEMSSLERDDVEHPEPLAGTY